MSIISFVVTNWDSVLVVLIALVGLIILYKRGEVGIIKEILFALVTKAEQEFGGGTGELKKAAVVEWLYDKLPAILRLFIGQKEIDNLIDEALAYAKTKWANNPRLMEHITGQTE